MTAPGFMAVEPLMVTRLESALSDIPGIKVFTAQDIDAVSARGQHSPAVHVVYAGPDVSERDGLVEVVERWYTVVAVRNSADQVGGQKAREAAGPIMDAVWSALFGWSPADGIKALQPVSPPSPGWLNGFGFYPLAWNVRAKKISYPCPTSP